MDEDNDFRKMEALLHIAAGLRRDPSEWGDCEDAAVVQWAADELQAHLRLTADEKRAVSELRSILAQRHKG